MPGNKVHSFGHRKIDNISGQTFYVSFTCSIIGSDQYQSNISSYNFIFVDLISGLLCMYSRRR